MVVKKDLAGWDKNSVKSLEVIDAELRKVS